MNSQRNKPTLLLIHGWGYDCGVFMSLIKYLEPYVNCQTMNLPGYAGQAYTQVNTARDASDWIMSEWNQAESGPVSLLAWSMGSLVGIELLKRYPEVFTRGMFLAGTPCFAQQEDWEDAMPVSLLESFIEKYQSAPTQTQNQFAYMVSEGEPDQRQWLRILREQNLAEPNVAALEDGLTILAQSDLRSDFAHLDQPILGLYGEKDSLVPNTVVEALKKLNADYEVRVFREAGHAVFLTHAEEVAREILAFLVASE